jgi:hypothetical protein
MQINISETISMTLTHPERIDNIERAVVLIVRLEEQRAAFTMSLHAARDLALELTRAADRASAVEVAQ